MHSLLHVFVYINEYTVHYVNICKKKDTETEINNNLENQTETHVNFFFIQQDVLI